MNAGTRGIKLQLQLARGNRSALKKTCPGAALPTKYHKELRDWAQAS